MALIIKTAIAGYLHAERNLIDPRVQDWFLVRNSWLVLGIVLFYNYGVTILGPNLMKNRKPFELKNTLIAYNIIQVILSVYICLECAWLYLNGYSFKCQPMEWDESPRAMRAASVVWLYYIVKVVDLLDTVFFVMRKKYNQVTFLHLYHHSGMVAVGHVGTKYLPGGHAVFLPLINSAVHAVMYGYYLLTVYKPETRSNLWLKKKVTQIQIIQFLFTTVGWTLPLFYRCGYPAWVSFMMVPQNICIFVLFSEFYVRTYWMKPKKAQREETMNVTAEQKAQ